jgi:deoxyadenosine/deoxycytidine kinase
LGKLVAIVGNSGVGKTTLAERLRARGDFAVGLEQQIERPFQAFFKTDLRRYAFANQVDYLLLRAEQELALRGSPQPGILDGGLEEDFYVFTRHFHNKGYLDEAEFQLCQRLYHLLRQTLPPPDVILRLAAPLDVILARFASRGRALEIATLDDLQALEILLSDWLAGVDEIPVVIIDASADDPSYEGVVEILMPQLRGLLGG